MRMALLFSALALPAAAWEAAVPYPGPQPGTPEVVISEDGTPRGLKNEVLFWEAAPLFTLTTTEDAYSSEEDYVASERVAGEAAAEGRSRGGSAQPGKTLSATFCSERSGLAVTWRAELREDAHYVRETYTLTAHRDVELTSFTPLILQEQGYSVPGEVPGTPLVNRQAHTFCSVELPVAQAEVKDGRARMGFACCLPLAAGQSVSFSTVSGVFPEGQLRRAFLAYLERERAVPYHPFLQYNCRYDHGLNPTEQKMLGTIADYAAELVQKRGVVPDAFVLDGGWDDYQTDFWQPHPQKFPRGFAPLRAALQELGSHLGVRISPLGGSAGAGERVAHAVRLGVMPQGSRELDFAHPAYRAWFSGRCRELMEKDGVNCLIWDKVGDGVTPHFMALRDMARELRALNPQLFLSTAAGTWPSPFWLHIADCTGRAGSAELGWAGEGSNRDRAITYRDAACYRLIVQRAPLYPLNSLMHHGLVLGREFQARYTSDMRRELPQPAAPPAADGLDAPGQIDFPVNNDLRADARILFASGANLQELYLTPEMMDSRAWDDVAEAVRWSRRRAGILADAHWVGGDPARGEVYGYAAWRAGKGATLGLRNPASFPRCYELTTADFELPEPQNIALRAAYADQRVQALRVPCQGAVRIELEPFEVLVFEADSGASSENAEKISGK